VVCQSAKSIEVFHASERAETYCYLQRHNIQLVKDKDPVLYKKCKIAEKFVQGPVMVPLAKDN